MAAKLAKIASKKYESRCDFLTKMSTDRPITQYRYIAPDHAAEDPISKEFRPALAQAGAVEVFADMADAIFQAV